MFELETRYTVESIKKINTAYGFGLSTTDLEPRFDIKAHSVFGATPKSLLENFCE